MTNSVPKQLWTGSMWTIQEETQVNISPYWFCSKQFTIMKNGAKSSTPKCVIGGASVILLTVKLFTFCLLKSHLMEWQIMQWWITCRTNKLMLTIHILWSRNSIYTDCSSQQAFTCSELTIETVKQTVKHVQS